MKTHWTERSVKDYLYRIATDFIAQLEKKMELDNITQDKLAERLSITKGRVSQLFNHPGNITLGNVVKFSRTLGMKVSIVAYEDDDIENKKGPINSEIFAICWEKLNKPRDFWAIQEIDRKRETASNIIEDKGYIHPESIVVTYLAAVNCATNDNYGSLPFNRNVNCWTWSSDNNSKLTSDSLNILKHGFSVDI